MFNTYILNLDSENERYNKQLPELNKLGINPIRVSGVLGKPNINNTNVSNMCKLTCPYSVIGCALGHYKIYEQFIQDDTNNVCLILEDDAFPKFNDKMSLYDVLFKYNPNTWDILQLHCDSLNKRDCGNSVTHMSGSNAAYFITKKGAKKMLSFKIHTHIDLETNLNKQIVKLKTPNNLFYTDEDDSSNRNDLKFLDFINANYDVGEKKIKHFLSFKSFRIPFTNKNILVFHIIIINFIVIFLTLYFIKKYFL